MQPIDNNRGMLTEILEVKEPIGWVVLEEVPEEEEVEGMAITLEEGEEMVVEEEEDHIRIMVEEDKVVICISVHKS